MSIYGRPNFRAATRAETPAFAAAVAKQAQLDQDAKARVNALRSQNMLGAAHIYNQGMGDKTPISDMLFGAETAPVDPTAGAGVAGTPTAAATPTAGAELATVAALPTAAGAGTAAGAAGGAAGAIPATAAGGSALSSALFNPVTAGLAGAYLLSQTDLGEDIQDSLSDGIPTALRMLDPFNMFS